MPVFPTSLYMATGMLSLIVLAVLYRLLILLFGVIQAQLLVIQLLHIPMFKVDILARGI